MPADADALRSWAASMGCPMPADVDAINRGRFGDLLRLLTEHVRPRALIDHVGATFRLHGASAAPSEHDDRVLSARAQADALRARLQGLRRSLASTQSELNHQGAMQTTLQERIDAIATTSVAIDRAIDANQRDQISSARVFAQRLDLPIGDDAPGETPSLKLEGGKFRVHNLVTVAVDRIAASMQAVLEETLARIDLSASTCDLILRQSLLGDIVQLTESEIAVDDEDARSETVNAEADPVPPTIQELIQTRRAAHLVRFNETMRAANEAHVFEGVDQRDVHVRRAIAAARLQELRRQISLLTEQVEREESVHQKLLQQKSTLDALDGERDQLGRLLTDIIKSNRRLRSALGHMSRKFADVDQESVEPQIMSISQRIEQIKGMFEQEVDQIRRRSEHHKPPIWESICQVLGSQVLDPGAILPLIVSIFQRSSALALTNDAELTYLDRDRSISLPDTHRLGQECEMLRNLALGEWANMLTGAEQVLATANKTADQLETLVSEWWEQPAQFLVPSEQRLGLNIHEWIVRRRKLIAQLRNAQDQLVLK